MSRTDAHRPLWVIEQDPTMRHHFLEKHDHRYGSCDLAERLADPRLPYKATRCHLWFRGLIQTCSCELCSARGARKYRRRRERAEWRSHRQTWLKGGQPRPPRNLETWFGWATRPNQETEDSPSRVDVWMSGGEWEPGYKEVDRNTAATCSANPERVTGTPQRQPLSISW